jgi:predicted PurR-regulated permease PerM
MCCHDGVPRALASLLVIGALVGAGGTLAYRLSDEAVSALRNLPQVTSRLRSMAQRVGGQSVVSELQSAADAVTNAAAGRAPRRQAGQPLPVQIIEPAIDVKGYVWLGWRSLFDFGSQGLLVAFLAFFMLTSGDLFRRKLVRLAGARLSDRRVTVELLDEIGGQISRFLLHQALTGSIVGLDHDARRHAPDAIPRQSCCPDEPGGRLPWAPVLGLGVGRNWDVAGCAAAHGREVGGRSG